METNLPKYKKDIDILIENGYELQKGLYYELRNEFTSDFEKLSEKQKAELAKYSFKNKYNEWYNEALSIIKQLVPDRLDDFKAYYKLDKRKDITYSTYTISDYLINITVRRSGEIIASPTSVISKFEQQYYIVKSLKHRFESSLYDVKQLLQADVFDSEIDSARELCKKGFYRASGAICGVIIEKHLNEVCNQHQITISKKHPAINDYNELLKTNNVIDIPVWRNIQRLADLRNLCDHHKNTEPTKEDIEELIIGTDKVLKTIF